MIIGISSTLPLPIPPVYPTTPTWNPADSKNILGFSEANKRLQMGTTTNDSGCRSFGIPKNGKVYFEVEILSVAASNGTPHFGIRRLDELENVGAAATVEGTHYYNHPNGVLDGPTTRYAGQLGGNLVNTTWQMAIDWDTGKWWMGYENAWRGPGGNGTGNPSTGANSLDPLMPLGVYEWACHVEIHSAWGGNEMRLVTDLPSFQYTPPTNYSSWDDAI